MSFRELAGDEVIPNSLVCVPVLVQRSCRAALPAFRVVRMKWEQTQRVAGAWMTTDCRGCSLKAPRTTRKGREWRTRRGVGRRADSSPYVRAIGKRAR